MTEREHELDRLLRDLADVGPLPSEVEASLDATLATLVTDRRPADEVSAARRRRRWAIGLTGAAAVMIGAVGVGVVVDSPVGGSADSASAGADVLENAPGATSDSAGSASAGRGAKSGAESARPRAEAPTPLSSDGVRTGDFGALSGAAIVMGAPSFTAEGFTREIRSWFAAHAGELPTWVGFCTPVTTAPGAHFLAVTYDGRPATLAVLPPRAGRQVVQVYSCTDGEVPMDATSVPAL